MWAMHAACLAFQWCFLCALSISFIMIHDSKCIFQYILMFPLSVMTVLKLLLLANYSVVHYNKICEVLIIKIRNHFTLEFGLK